MAPSFFCMVYGMRQSSNAPQRITQQGIWRPPTGLGHNRKVGDTSETLYYFDGTNFRPLPPEIVPAIVDELMVYRDMSVYFDDEISIFWAVPYDATEQGVGEDGEEENTNDWGLVRFDYGTAENPNPQYASTITYNGQHQKLWCQRPNQRWCDTLLPPTYHKPPNEQTSNEHGNYGGLIGQLNLIIALFAFSVQADRVPLTLRHCMRNGSWRGPRLDDDEIGRGRLRTGRSRRGLVVRVFVRRPSPGKNPEQDLKEFELGFNGKILD